MRTRFVLASAAAVGVTAVGAFAFTSGANAAAPTPSPTPVTKATVTLLQANGTAFPASNPLSKPLAVSDVSIDQATAAPSAGAPPGTVGKPKFNPLSVSLAAGPEQVPLLTTLTSGQRLTVKLDVPMGNAQPGSTDPTPYFEYTLGVANLKTTSFSYANGDEAAKSEISFIYAALRTTSFAPNPSPGGPLVATTSCYSTVSNTANGTGC
jgi:hypothetical protein